jgi:hypothetical protein
MTETNLRVSSKYLLLDYNATVHEVVGPILERNGVDVFPVASRTEMPNFISPEGFILVMDRRSLDSCDRFAAIPLQIPPHSVGNDRSEPVPDQPSKELPPKCLDNFWPTSIARACTREQWKRSDQQ